MNINDHALAIFGKLHTSNNHMATDRDFIMRYLNKHLEVKKIELKWEPGKFYKCRNGTKSVCLGVNNHPLYPIRLFNFDENDFEWHRVDGGAYSDQTSSIDVVDYWRD